MPANSASVLRRVRPDRSTSPTDQLPSPSRPLPPFVLSLTRRNGSTERTRHKVRMPHPRVEECFPPHACSSALTLERALGVRTCAFRQSDSCHSRYIYTHFQYAFYKSTLARLLYNQNTFLVLDCPQSYILYPH